MPPLLLRVKMSGLNSLGPKSPLLVLETKSYLKKEEEEEEEKEEKPNKNRCLRTPVLTTTSTTTNFADGYL